MEKNYTLRNRIRLIQNETTIHHISRDPRKTKPRNHLFLPIPKPGMSMGVFLR